MHGSCHSAACRCAAWPRSRVAALCGVLLLLAGCGGDTAGGDAGAAPTSTVADASATPVETELPAAEDISGSSDTIQAQPYPDYALAAGGLIWVGNVDPGIVGFDPTTGERRFEVPTGRIKVGMEQGLGALWAAEVTADGQDTALLRVDLTTGEVMSRTPAPGNGIVSNSSLAVAGGSVWALTGLFESPYRTLAEFGPDGVLRNEEFAPEGAKAVRGGFESLWITTGDGVVRIDPADLDTQVTIETGRGAGALTVTEDAVWVLNTLDGTVSRVDPQTDALVTTITVSDGSVARGDIAAGEGSVWVRTSRELASEIDVATNAVVRVLGPGQPASGSIAVADGTVWITTQSGHTIHRVATT